MVIGRTGIMIVQNNTSLNGVFKTSLNFKATTLMFPRAQLLVYSTFNNVEVVHDTVDIEFEAETPNKVKKIFSCFFKKRIKNIKNFRS
jgi:Alpha-2-macroglobulin bait region domain